MALVITLILLAVITTLAIAFLALTYRETASVDSMGRTTDAELATDAALERAKAEILAPFPVRNVNFETNGPNLLGPDLIVSVCCQNQGLVPIDRGNWEMRLDPTNYLNSAPPVFIDRNRPGQNGPIDDRFTLDLNRNDTFEESGFVPVIDDNGQVVRDQAGNIETTFVRGDPQWIGILQNPRRIHGPDNRFIARYAFMVLPAGRSLDLNWIHNRAKFSTPTDFGYFRNQGIGAWEMNFAAFLADLNPGIWNTNSAPLQPYQFDPYPNSPDAQGTAFADALEILNYRYNGWQPNPDNADSLFGPSVLSLQSDLVDQYADNALVPLGGMPSVDNDLVTNPWPGADSTNHFHSLHDLFDDRKLPGPNAPQRGFRDHLREASIKRSTFDRYTFYRMLEQLGTDSVADDEEGKININYVNIGGIKASELVRWTDDATIQSRIGGVERPTLLGSELFFLSAVTNLLARDPYLTNRFAGVSLVNTNPDALRDELINKPLRIPVYLDGSRYPKTGIFTNDPYYSSRIHQILQQAANIYDATRAGLGPAENPASSTDFPRFYPSIFRPQFEVVDTPTNFNVYIVNYKLVTENASQFKLFNGTLGTWRDLEMGEKPTPITPAVSDNGVYGIPWIVGARKGFPSFNEFAMESFAYATRRLKIFRSPGTTNTLRMDEIFTLKVTNRFQAEIWNSYKTAYPRPLDVFFRYSVTNLLTNSLLTPVLVPTTGVLSGFVTTNKLWKPNEYLQPVLASNVVLSLVLSNDASKSVGRTNEWALAVRNRILCFLTEGERIVDAVSLLATNAEFTFGSELVRVPYDPGTTAHAKGVWDARPTKSQPNLSLGQQLQLEISSNDSASTLADWANFGATVQNRTDGIRNFNTAMTNTQISEIDVPFVLARRMQNIQRWEVNDPLVHYTVEDLWLAGTQETVDKNRYQPISITKENSRYVPWDDGGVGSGSDPDRYTSLRDISVTSPQAWDFPTNQLPGIGWLGRVHRGTPWQTVYFKDRAAADKDWRIPSGQMRSLAESRSIHPTNDWRLADAFTSSIHPNATRGRLSVNQTNLAAWSALLAGAVGSTVIETNDPNIGQLLLHADTLLEPNSASANADIQKIVDGINATRAGRTNLQFGKLSDIFAVPQLTTESPLLYNQNVLSKGFDSTKPPPGPITPEVLDRDYERIPEQILSLLKVGEPRFVIYAWGQSLKPARLGVAKTGPNPGDIELRGPSILTADDPASGKEKGYCNNYQITGELAIRAVVRVEFEKDPLTLTPDYRKAHAVVESYNIVPVE